MDTVAVRLAAIDRPNDLSLEQAEWLAQAAKGKALALDLGTGWGNSCAVLSLCCERVLTFGHDDSWTRHAAPKLKGVDNVEPFIGDLTTVDFRPLVQDASSVVVFWDAHGFDVAEHVLSHIMPAIAEKEHLVICHDMWAEQCGSYENKRIWRGMQSRHENPKGFVTLGIGNVASVVDQALVVLDFCNRNRMPIHATTDFVYFTMNETTSRHFPRAVFP